MQDIKRRSFMGALAGALAAIGIGKATPALATPRINTKTATVITLEYALKLFAQELRNHLPAGCRISDGEMIAIDVGDRWQSVEVKSFLGHTNDLDQTIETFVKPSADLMAKSISKSGIKTFHRMRLEPLSVSSRIDWPYGSDESKGISVRATQTVNTIIFDVCGGAA